MKVKFIVFISIVVALIGSVSYGYYLAKDITKIDFEKHTENPYLTDTGFAIPIKILVDNPSKVTLPINKVEYKGVLEKTGEVITEGSIENIQIKKMDKTWINETVNVKWEKTPTATLQLLSEDKVWVNVKLKVHFGPIEIPYTTRVDVKESIKSQVPSEAFLEELPTLANQGFI